MGSVLISPIMAETDHSEPPEWKAELRHIFTSAGHDYWGRQGEGRMQSGIQSLSEVECVAGMGLRGEGKLSLLLDDRAVAPGTMAYLKPNCRGGLRAKIVTSGVLRVG